MFETARLVQTVKEKVSDPFSTLIKRIQTGAVSFTRKTIREDDLLSVAVKVK